jgi:hypothetical protein
MRFLITTVAAVLLATGGSAQICQFQGNQTRCDNGLSAQRYGNRTYWNDGTSSTRYGNTTYYSDGTSSHRNGNGTYFSVARQPRPAETQPTLATGGHVSDTATK